jgi:hypothetical protein
MQDLGSFLPEGYSMHCCTDTEQVELIVFASPEGSRIVGSAVPHGMPTTSAELRQMASTGRFKELEKLRGSSATAVLQLLLIASLAPELLLKAYTHIS